jgi:hypothetical protein
MENASKLSLVGETEFGAVVERNRQMFEALRLRVVVEANEAARHTQVNEQGGVVVEVGNQVFAASA